MPKAASTMEAEYRCDYAYHAQMEPLNAIASVAPAGDSVEIWAGTQSQSIACEAPAKLLGNGPKAATAENLKYPEIGRLDLLPLNGAHTAIPLGKVKIAEFAKDLAGGIRDIVMIVNESLVNECQERVTRQMVFFVDATVESRPMVVSNFNVPEASGNFCTRGGRFGAHSANESTAPVFHNKLAFVTWFNAIVGKDADV